MPVWVRKATVAAIVFYLENCESWLAYSFTWNEGTVSFVAFQQLSGKPLSKHQIESG